jgi:type I restriction enzyme S subunit
MSNQIAEVSPKYLIEEASNPVPAGYKQTEVGVIPEDWEVLPLSSLTRLMTNGFVGTAKSHYTDSHDGITYIQGYNVKENGFNYHGIKKVTPDFHKRNAKSCLRTGDVLMVQTGDVGLVTIVPPELEGANCHALIINRFKANYQPKYFAYFLNSSQGRQRLKELETGTTMKHINVGDLLHFEIPFPKLKEEQTAIANALSDVDALISELEKLISKKQAIKTATMQQLLTGRTRLPQFALREDGTRKGTKPSELGKIPEDWEIVQLGDCSAYVGSGKSNTKSTGDFPLYGSTGLIGSCTNPEYSGEALLVARVGANAGRLNYVAGEYGVSDNTIIVKLKQGNNIHFFKYWLVRKNLNTLVFGSGQPLITGTQLKDLALPLPSEKEQTAIATILSDMDAEIQVLEQRLGKTRQIKQGMMQELLTGKTRLMNA